MVSQDDIYRYAPLNPERREIRLIQTAEQLTFQKKVIDLDEQPTEFFKTPWADGSLPITMAIFAISDAPPFIALSYVWGSNERDNEISCGGKILRVTANLRKSLRILTIRDGWMWADAICINQADVAERNSQVRLMRDIYSSAVQVIAHVGDPPDMDGILTTMALKAIKDDLSNEHEDDDGLISQEQRGEYGEAINQLLSQPWFSRAWIMQEAVLNSDCRLWYGNADFDISDLLSTVNAIQRHSGKWNLQKGSGQKSHQIQLSVLRRNFLQIDSIGRMRSYMISKGEVPLIRALHLGRNADATDLRDKVYAFLGFVDKEVQQALQPDYSPGNSVDDVLLALGQYCLKSPFARDMLRYAGYVRDSLPSWVPDWTIYPRAPFAYRAYTCSGESTLRIQQVKDQPLQIMLRGAIIDSITQVFPRCNFGFGNDMLIEGMPESDHSGDGFFASLLLDSMFVGRAQMFYSVDPYPTKETLTDVVWRTITADRSSRTDGRADVAIDRLGFEAFGHLYRPAQLGGRTDAPGVHDDILFRRADAYHSALALAQGGRRGAFTKNRYLAVAPETAEEGDVLAVILGCPMPFVLRPLNSGEGYRLIGEAYVHGIMDGELMQFDEPQDEPTVKGFDLVDLKII